MSNLLWRVRRKSRSVIAKLFHPFNEVERTYFYKDPWGLGTPRETERFMVMNDIIRRNIGPIKTILEIGSGEGHQTELLSNIGLVHGVEISKIAVSRARRRVPQATFEVGALPKVSCLGADLVCAFEVLYYLSDIEIPVAVRALTQAAPHRMVSYHHNKKSYDKVQGRLDPIILSLPGVQSQVIELYGEKWTVAWW